MSTKKMVKKMARKQIMVLMTVFIFTLSIIFSGCMESQQINQSELKPIVNEIFPLIKDCYEMDSDNIPIFRKGKSIVWDLQNNSLSQAHYMLPNNLQASPLDSEITIFLVIDEGNYKSGSYSLIGETYSSGDPPGYTEVRDICVIYWPENIIVGKYTVRAPPPFRSSDDTPKYGNPIKPIAESIKNIPDIYDDKAMEALIQDLKHESRSVRYDAGTTLSIIGDERAVETLIQVLDDYHPSVKSNL